MLIGVSLAGRADHPDLREAGYAVTLGSAYRTAATRASRVADSIAVRYKRRGKFIHLRGKQLRTGSCLLAEDSVHDLGAAGTI
jgi:hypothetical protein